MALPPILIGPILRRTEPRAVSVFVATSTSADVRVTLYPGPGLVDAASLPPPIAAASTRTTRFAAAFHAVVVTVPLAAIDALQPGRMYAYDVTVTLDGEAARSLLELGLLGSRELPPSHSVVPPGSDGIPSAETIRRRLDPVEVVPLGYGENALPAFVTCPAVLDDLVLAHSSCRKPHGDGTPALQHLDRFIEGLEGAVGGRPNMLFLTGDQIYADDVAPALLPGISDLGLKLLGAAERVPSPIAGNEDMVVNTVALPAGFRQKTTGLAGFTSDYAACHLIGFGEFLAMYCVAWNPELWPVLAVVEMREFGTSTPTPDGERGQDRRERLRAELQEEADAAPDGAPTMLGRPDPDGREPEITPLYAAGLPEAVEALRHAREDYLASRPLLDDYRREVPRVRRLLANNPTYMICDDHDVTDDWFMTAKIRAQTLANPFGRALVRNALAAFSVCQAWGNDPVTWSDAAHGDLLNSIAAMFAAPWDGGLPAAPAADAVVQTLGLTPAGRPRLDFSLTVDGPMHRVRVLDTRTRREYDTPLGAPGLLTAQALDEQLPLEDLPDGHVLVVVSPAPVYGPPVLNEIGGAILQSKRDIRDIHWSRAEREDARAVTGLEYGSPLGMQYYDAEHWGLHEVAFERLLERLSHHRRVVVLGGDVHYGAAYAMDWTGAGRTSRIVHLTSSAAKNDWKDTPGNLGPPGVVHNLFALNGFATGLQKVGLPMTRLGWSATLPAVVTGLEQEPPRARLRVQTGPVVLSDELFRASHELTRPPEWVWRAQAVVDERPSDQRPLGARVVQPAAEISAIGDGVRDYDVLAGAHVQSLRTQAIARGMQFLNNVGIVTFASGGGGLRVSQALHSIRPRPEANEAGDAYIVHTTSLEPDPVAFPTHVGPQD